MTLGVVFIPVVIFVLWFAWEMLRDDTPQFFPINEPSGEYVISKNSGIFVVDYRGPNAFSVIDTDNDGTISVVVGKTAYDLEQYLGKQVVITKGSFRGRFREQCIASRCTAIGGPYAAVVIEEMYEK